MNGAIAEVRTPGRPLDASDFIPIALPGFGDPRNIVAHAMAWFRDRLYVATTRVSEQALQSGSFQAGVHSRRLDPGQRAEIWSYEPDADAWRKVFVSPLVRLPNGSVGPREIGYRNMVVFQSPIDPSPVLYAGTISMMGTPMVRSSDGMNFTRSPGPIDADGITLSYRSLVSQKGRLYTSPIGLVSGKTVERNRAATPAVFESSNPASGPWRQVSETGFGDGANLAVFEIAAFHKHLYAGTFNPYAGLQIWKTRVGEASYHWKRVVTDGAFRGNTNESVASMCQFRDALYVGTGIQGLSWDPNYGAGPGAAELIRIYPDDRWEIVVGEPRRTSQGLKFPVSGRGPGFDNPFSCVIWRLAEHDNWLYAGTYDWSALIGVLSRFTPRLRDKVSRFVEREGGCDLWRSHDGTSWEPVTRNGFDNSHNSGVRNLLPTPKGLFVGTQAVPPRGRQAFSGEMSYLPDGCEVLWGRRTHTANAPTRRR